MIEKFTQIDSRMYELEFDESGKLPFIVLEHFPQAWHWSLTNSFDEEGIHEGECPASASPNTAAALALADIGLFIAGLNAAFSRVLIPNSPGQE